MKKPLLLHGPATSASRRKLIQLKENFDPDNVVVFDTLANPGQVLANLMAVPMFSESRLIIWENPTEEFQISNFKFQINLVLWFDHKIDPAKWPGFESMFFAESQEISAFPFLDSLAIGDKKAYLEAEKLKNSGYDVHYFLSMVFYLLRSLAVTPKNAPDFVRRKLERQRERFSPEKIIGLYKDLIEIEFKIKSGFLEKSQAEFLLINKFFA